MRWLFFVLSAICFVVAFRTYSVGLAALMLLLALGFLLAGVFALASHRIEARARDEVHIMSPQELRRMREQAEQRRTGQATAGAPQTGPAAPPPEPPQDLPPERPPGG